MRIQARRTEIARLSLRCGIFVKGMMSVYKRKRLVHGPSLGTSPTLALSADTPGHPRPPLHSISRRCRFLCPPLHRRHAIAQLVEPGTHGGAGARVAHAISVAYLIAAQKASVGWNT